MCSISAASGRLDKHLLIGLFIRYHMTIVLVLDISQKSPWGFNWRFSKKEKICKKNCNFFKVWGVASIGDAATIRNFTVVEKNVWSNKLI